MVENYTPRVIEQFDLGWDVVHATNPRAVMVRMPAFGLDGPWRDRPGFAQTMEQVTGLAWLTGHVDDQPRIQRGPCDPNGGMHAVVGALVALELRDRTGVGSLVESTMFEAALNISAELDRRVDRVRQRAVARGKPEPVGRAAGRLRAPTRRSGGSWCRWRPTSSGRRWSTRSGGRTGRPTPSCAPTRAGARAPRPPRREARRVGGRHRPRRRRSICCSAAGVPAAPAVDARTTSEHPQFVARGYYEYPEHPVIGVRGHPSVPFRFAGVDHWLRTAVADARPAQPRDPHRPRPLRRRDRRARGHRRHRDRPARPVKEKLHGH